jgi:hypothetical protein
MTAAPVRRAPKRDAQRPPDSRASLRGALRRSCRAESSPAGGELLFIADDDRRPPTRLFAAGEQQTVSEQFNAVAIDRREFIASRRLLAGPLGIDGDNRGRLGSSGGEAEVKSEIVATANTCRQGQQPKYRIAAATSEGNRQARGTHRFLSMSCQLAPGANWCNGCRARCEASRQKRPRVAVAVGRATGSEIRRRDGGGRALPAFVLTTFGNGAGNTATSIVNGDGCLCKLCRASRSPFLCKHCVWMGPAASS